MNEVEMEELKTFFLEFSGVAYASGREPEIVPYCIPGAKGYFYQKQIIGGNRYEYADVYFDAGQGRSFGFTTLGINGKCVWTMRYHGECKREYVGEQKVTEFLKKALLSAYEKRRFCGGRGEAIFVEGNLQYENHSQRKNLGFESFSGGETIADISLSHKSDIVFFHKFEGGLVQKE